MMALKDSLAISNGSACTTSSYDASHVLLAMGLNEDEAAESVRISFREVTDPKTLGLLAETVQKTKLT